MFYNILSNCHAKELSYTAALSLIFKIKSQMSPRRNDHGQKNESHCNRQDVYKICEFASRHQLCLNYWQALPISNTSTQMKKILLTFGVTHANRI